MLLVLAALFNFGFAIFHAFFWRLFNWPASLAESGRINTGVIQILNLCLTYVFVALSVWFAFGEPPAISLLAVAGFWAFRAALQPVFFTLRSPFSIGMFGLFIAGAILHAAAGLHGL